jgi:Leucine-rich repeat (LRR) protein
MSTNDWSGTIPSTISAMTSLAVIWLNANRLVGTIPELGRLTNLRGVYLYHNMLSGTIQSQIGLLTNMLILQWFNNSLSGAIPSSIGRLTSLSTQWLNDNKLAGTIPTQIAVCFLLGRRRNKAPPPTEEPVLADARPTGRYSNNSTTLIQTHANSHYDYLSAAEIGNKQEDKADF